MLLNLLTSTFNSYKRDYPYEIKKRNNNVKQKQKQLNKKTSIERKSVKKNSGRKRYGQNKLNKKSFLNKRKTDVGKNSSWKDTSKLQKVLNKFKHKTKNINIYPFNVSNSLNANSTITMSKDCETVKFLMEKWNIDVTWWGNIDFSEEENFNKTNMEYYGCCYNNNYVVCEDNKIVELNIDENEINVANPEIPEEICELTDLTKLWLYFNNLNGTIPTSIGELSNLKSLNLHGNDLSGTIPNEIGNLINLETLDLHSNKLEGEIPNSINKLENLKRLYLNNNQFNITDVSYIPTKVEKCDLTNNNMSNSVYNTYKESLTCSSSISNISSISFQGILIFLLINIIIFLKS
ncbi:L domain-like protein [Piromyces finnis]|uniref:L domain-like protein n=1 Tax=Piromyces finnis TaxID=1754191 RepID=A0A1Y1VP16_9FUNG|nr:L domain-like protein [Piromyces finnis]|eukprot:ORX61157.1 L domain-like protein [Piromyces finnis]